MTNSEKATQVLDFLEGLTTRDAINALSPLIDDDALAGLYDKLVEEEIIKEQKQRAKLIAIYSKSDDCYETLTNEYQNFDLDSFVERAKILYPTIFRDDEVSEVEGEIQNENERYILTWEDAIEECVRIYEK